MNRAPTICEECEHMHPDSRGGPSYRAMCMRHKRTVGAQFVAQGVWDKDSPYLLCRDVNGGACPLWESRRDNQMELEPEGDR